MVMVLVININRIVSIIIFIKTNIILMIIVIVLSAVYQLGVCSHCAKRATYTQSPAYSIACSMYSIWYLVCSMFKERDKYSI